MSGQHYPDQMYVPRANVVAQEADVRAMVREVGSAELVTVGADGFPRATLLPVLWDGDTVVAHIAKANDHWRELADGMPALLICTGPQAYVTPSWYAAKAEHGRVVPTWNYSTVHLRGRITVHQDESWLREAVSRLSDRHEQDRADPWSVTDAPEPFVAGQLRAIVGIEVTVDQVDAKAKLSQNRPEVDQRAVAAGLAAGTPTEAAVAEKMERLLDG